MLFRTTTVEGTEFTFTVKLKLVREDNPRCSQTGFILRFRGMSESENGGTELKEMFEQKHIMPEFLFGCAEHRHLVKQLLRRLEIWPQDVDVDLDTILDMAFFDAKMKVYIDKARSGPSFLRNIIPTITFDIIKLEHEDDVDYAIALGQSMREASKTTPATKESIKNLKKVKLENPNTEQCTICMEQLVSNISETEDDENEIVSMPCSHLFHGSCIQQWLNISHQCPLCRFLMPAQR